MKLKNTLTCLLSVPILYTSNPSLQYKFDVRENSQSEIINTYKEYNKRTVSHNRKIYNVEEIGGDFIITDESDSKVYLSHDDLSDVIFTYYMDKKIDEFSAEKLSGDVETLENLVAGSVIKGEIMNAIKSVWKNKSNVSGMLSFVFNFVDSMEIDPKFYAKVLIGNISAQYGPVQIGVVALYEMKGSVLDSKMAKAIYKGLSESEPLVEPSIDYLRAALTSPNYELSEDEKKELKKLDPAKRREKIIEKIKNTPEFDSFEAETNRRADEWDSIKK